MARINFDDRVESAEEFWALLRLVAGDRDRALGMLLRLFRIGQEAYKKGTAIQASELRAKGLEPMIESGWVVPYEDGFMVLGAEKHFDWIKQRVEAGRNGGLKRAENAKRSLAPATVLLDNPKRDVATAYPLAPALAPALAKIQIQGTPQSPQGGAGISPEDMTQALEEWGRTLKHYGRDRNPRLDEVQIYGLLKSKGLPRLRNALRGFCGEVKGDGYDPAKHMNIMRLTKSDSFSHLEALGESLANEATAKPRKNRAKTDCEQCRGVGMYLPPLDEDSDSSTNVMKSCECVEEQTA